MRLRILEFILLQTYNGACKPTKSKIIRPKVCLRRTGGSRNSELFSKLYKSLALPILEYCSPVWFPHLKKGLNALEKVQRRASKCAFGNFGRDMSYEERLMVLKWPTLEQRRLFLQMVLRLHVIFDL